MHMPQRESSSRALGEGAGGGRTGPSRRSLASHAAGFQSGGGGRPLQREDAQPKSGAEVFVPDVSHRYPGFS